MTKLYNFLVFMCGYDPAMNLHDGEPDQDPKRIPRKDQFDIWVAPCCAYP
jgi:hypothetical protein